VGSDKDKVRFSIEWSPEREIHVSLHESGVVSITTGEANYRLRAAHKRSRLEIVTLGIKEPTGLRVAVDEEVNSLPARYKVVPAPGFFMLSPVFVTIFRVRTPDKWEVPHLSQTRQTQVGFKPGGTETRYEPVVGQNPNIPKFPGDIAFSPGS
jgi:hypothetical protein